MTKAQKQEQQEAVDKLREWIKPGDTVYTILDHVSQSGMTRHIRVVLMMGGDPATPCHPNYMVGLALGLRHGKRKGREVDGLVMGGCGMDMGFALVYDLSHKLYPEYTCLGERCPSNSHVNDRHAPRGSGVVHTDGYAVSQLWL